MRTQRPYLAEINVTPFVDVMLVLLAIFMITAPLMQQGMDVQLPNASTAPVDLKKVPTVTLKANKTIYWDQEEAADLLALRGKLNAYVSESQNGGIYFRADKTLDYGFIMKVLATIRRAGVQNIGMMTEPLA